MEAQRDKGRAAWKGTSQTSISEVHAGLSTLGATGFTGYTRDQDKGSVAAIVQDG